MTKDQILQAFASMSLNEKAMLLMDMVNALGGEVCEDNDGQLVLYTGVHDRLDPVTGIHESYIP
jgi:hypothetical protein